MANPKTGGQFYVETHRQAEKAAAAAQDAGRRYIDELVDVSRAYFAAWSSTQQARMLALFQLQNSMIQASQIVLDATMQTNRALLDEWVKGVAEGQAAVVRMAAACADLVADSAPKGRV
jgi:hypothetical protein